MWQAAISIYPAKEKLCKLQGSSLTTLEIVSIFTSVSQFSETNLILS